MDLKTANERIQALAAPAGPGFFRENDSKAKKYFFYYVNKKGEVVLISKVYRTARSRNKVQQRLETGDYQVETVRLDRKYGYQIINGGDKSMAAGPLFTKQSARDTALASLPDSLRPKVVSNTPSPPAKEQPQRFSFRLNFYPSEDTGSWQGRISHPLTEQKKSFPDLDLEVVEEFIGSILKKSTKGGIRVKRRTTRDEHSTARQNEGNKPKLPTLPKAPTIPEQPLVILTGNQRLHGGLLNLEDSFDIEIKMEPSIKKQRTYRIQLFAKSLTNGRSTQLGDLAVDWTGDQQRLQLPLPTDKLTAGVYRLNADVVPTGVNPARAITHATSLVQFQ